MRGSIWIIRTLSVITAFVLTTIPSAASVGATTEGSICDAVSLITPGAALGTFSLVMSPAAALAVAGKPDKTLAYSKASYLLPGDHEVDYKYLAGPNRGLVINTRNGRLVGIEIIHMAPSEPLDTCATTSGIHLNGSTDTILHDYGSPPATVDVKGTEFAYWLFNAQGLLFYVDTNEHLIYRIAIFSPGTFCQLFPTSPLGCSTPHTQ